MHGDVAIDAGITKSDPAAQDVIEVAGHVVPMPAGFLVERRDGPDMARTDASLGADRQAEIAVFDIGARAISGEGCVGQRDQAKP